MNRELPPVPAPRETQSRAIRLFLTEQKTRFNADLIELFLASTPEVQINVRTDIGEARSDERPGHKPFKYRIDGNQKFWPVRWPKQADTAPNWETMPLEPFPLANYASDIGSTWFGKDGSLRVGFDVDLAFGHAGGGLTAAELIAFERTIEPLDYCELRRSTSGAGRHLYVPLSGIVVANHAEHAAIARALLGKLCLDAGLDFRHQIDCLGGNMWFWSRRATEENRGFELLRPAARPLTADELPSNWREHVDVVRRKRTSVRIAASIPDTEDQTEDDLWAELASAYPTTKPDDEHREILAALEKAGYALEYVADLNCWRAHTKALEKVHDELGLRGVFRTVSNGTDPGTANCFIFLRPKGAFYVARYKARNEHASWTQKTASGEAATLYNVAIDLKTAAAAVGAVWGGKFCTCKNVNQAMQLASMFGATLPELPSDRPVNFKPDGPDSVVVEAQQSKGETPDGWAIGYRKLVASFSVEPSPSITNEFDSLVRHVVTTEQEGAGWLLKDVDGNWNFERESACENALAHCFGLNKTEAKAAMGELVISPYLLVNEPFAKEFLPGRRWNKFGAQHIAPTYGGRHDHFDMVFRHVGAGLDEAVKADAWCNRHGIVDGAHFLMLWAAKKFQLPKQHLPMLYLYSKERDNGKSAFHKCLKMLYRRGCVEGVRMLNEQFNKMFAGAVLIYLDEEKVKESAAQRVKLYVDSDQVSIRMMRTDSFMLDNFSHWTASYNFTDGVPVEDGDERIIMVTVPELLDDEKLDWRDELRPALESEASDFLGTLLTMELPPSGGRLYLPVLDTALKQATTQSKQPTCDRDELFSRIVATMRQTGIFAGPSRDLLKLLGDGSWSSSRNHFRRYLKDIAERLGTAGVFVEFPTEKKIIITTRKAA